MSVSTTVMNLDDFEQYVSSLLPGIKRQYDRGINRDLSKQQWQDLFKRNITTVMQQVYQDALSQMQHSEFDRDNMAMGENGVNERILKPIHNLIDELMLYAVQKHRSSCALSNFPEEHNPSQDYIAQVLQGLDRDWSSFVAQVSALLPH